MKVLKVKHSEPHQWCDLCSWIVFPPFQNIDLTLSTETQEKEKSRSVQLFCHSLNSWSSRYLVTQLSCQQEYLKRTIEKKFHAWSTELWLWQLFIFRFFRETPKAAGRLERAVWGEDHDDGAYIQTGWNPRGSTSYAIISSRTQTWLLDLLSAFETAWFYLIITCVLCSSSSSIFTPLSRGSFSPIREVTSRWQTICFTYLLFITMND